MDDIGEHVDAERVIVTLQQQIGMLAGQNAKLEAAVAGLMQKLNERARATEPPA